MLKLMKLESQKYNLKRYIFKAFTITLILFSVLLLLFFAERDESELIFRDINLLFILTKTSVNISFLILASVMLGRIIIGEYDKKTISILFSYPISRKKLLLSKILLIGTFMATGIIISITFLTVTLYVISHIYLHLPLTVAPKICLSLLISMIINSLAYTCLSSISLYFGYKKKSSTRTIIVGVIIAMLLGSSNGNFSLGDMVLVPLSFALVGLISTTMLIKNIEQTDV